MTEHSTVRNAGGLEHPPATVEDAEHYLTAAEALSDGWFVAEWVRGDEVLRCYGATAGEARDRLSYDLDRGISVRTPAVPR